MGTLVLVTDITDLRTRFFNTMTVVFAASLLAAALGFLLSVPLQHAIASPIRKLTASMLRIKENRDTTPISLPRATMKPASWSTLSNSLIADIRFRDHSLQKLAYFDPLTGLPNRTNFQRTLQDALKARAGDGECLGVVLFNIDAFHTFNDAMGIPSATPC